MRSTSDRAVRLRACGPGSLFSLAALVTVAFGLLLSGSADEKRISIYSNAANYSVSVVERNGVDYVGLLETFEPLGAVSAKTSGSHWKFRYYDVESEFIAGKTRGRVRGLDFDLPANFLLENGRGLVPLSSLGTLLPRFLGGPVTFNQSSRRLFIGNVAIHFTAQVSKSNPPTLVLNFTSPVNPMIATEAGKLRMVFNHEPVVSPGSPTLTFDSKIIPSATYQEGNGAAEVEVAGSVPLMASFSNDGRTISIAPAPIATAPAPVPQAGGTPAAVQPAPSVSGAPAARGYFVVVDPSHGGEERGAALSDQLAEKDITLAFARRLRLELEARNLTTLLLRDGDTTLGLDQRAGTANAAQAALYICVHAASQGNGVRIYTTLVPAGAEKRGPFLDWDTAQVSFQPLSQTAQASLAAELMKKQVPVRSLSATLRPLNNITAAAVAIEVAPPAADVTQLDSPVYQQLIASSIAAGVADIRDKLEAGR